MVLWCPQLNCCAFGCQKLTLYQSYTHQTPPVAAEIFGNMSRATSSRGRSVLTMTNILCCYSFFDEVGVGVDEVDDAVVIGSVLIADAS